MLPTGLFLNFPFPPVSFPPNCPVRHRSSQIDTLRTYPKWVFWRGELAGREVPSLTGWGSLPQWGPLVTEKAQPSMRRCQWSTWDPELLITNIPLLANKHVLTAHRLPPNPPTTDLLNKQQSMDSCRPARWANYSWRPHLCTAAHSQSPGKRTSNWLPEWVLVSSFLSHIIAPIQKATEGQTLLSAIQRRYC